MSFDCKRDELEAFELKYQFSRETPAIETG
jgi:hypothetical protein